MSKDKSESKPKRKLKYVTLMWEELPESVSIYVIPRLHIGKAEIKMLKACHNNWVGTNAVNTDRADKDTVNRSLCRLSNMLLDPSHAWITQDYRLDQADACGVGIAEFNALLGKWSGYKLGTDEPRTLPRSRLYRSGFVS